MISICPTVDKEACTLAPPGAELTIVGYDQLAPVDQCRDRGGADQNRLVSGFSVMHKIFILIQQRMIRAVQRIVVLPA